MKMLKLIVALAFMIFAENYAQVSIVVNKSFEGTLSKNDVNQIYSGKKLNYSNGNNIIIVDQTETESSKAFYSALGLNPGQVKVEWTKLVLSGQMKAPLKCNSDDEVKDKVSKNKNAVGFILTKNIDGSVKELLKIQ